MDSVPTNSSHEFVFLNCDTSSPLADSLSRSLQDAGIPVVREGGMFFDYESGSIGLRGVIEQVKISIPIISKGYFSDNGRRVLKLAVSLESRRRRNQRVLPIFCGVTPDEVRNQTGLIGAIFSRLVKKYDHTFVQQCRDALREVGALKGFELKDTTDRRGEQYSKPAEQVVKLVVKEVLYILKTSYYGIDTFVGMENQIEAVMELVDIDTNDVRFIGIHGMGGIGKTTLARTIYTKIFDQFGEFCFLRNISDAKSGLGGLRHLKSMLENFRYFPSVDEVGFQLKDTIWRKKVLLVLDDVDHTDQIEELVPPLDWFVSGSRIIITTRNKDILSKIDCIYKYEVKELDQHHAFLLFCWHAFRRNSPPENLVTISREIVKATGGLPLSVETIGSYLFSEKDNVWEEALDRLKREPGIHNKLKISYNALDSKQKQMFLDIACFFIGSDVRIAAHMWRNSDLFSEAGIEVLKLMSIIKIGDDSKICVHDHFRDLGLEIVRQENIDEPKDRSRLWGTDALKLLKGRRKWLFSSRSKERTKVAGIRLDYGTGPHQYVISGGKFEGLPKIQYLDLANANLKGNFQACLPNLRWLGWHGHTELNIPHTLHLKNLIVLDLSKSMISENWNGWSSIEEAKKLEVLNLSSCHHLTRTPYFSLFPSMKRLILQDCVRLDTIDPSMANLKCLVFLDMRNCPMLKEIPKELACLGELTDLLIDGSSIEEIPDLCGMSSLVTFSAKSCRSLRRVPESFGSLLNVQKVLLDNCESLTEIPDTIGQLESLKELSLSNARVMNLPYSIGKWRNLEVLNINHCPIRCFPASLWSLEKLEVLNASSCLNLEGEIPSELANLTSLKILRLDHTNISSLPTSICGILHLHTLDLEGCMKLQSLPRLPTSLVSVKVTLTSPVSVPDLPDMINLKHLEFQRCNSFSVPKHPTHDAPSTSSSELIQPGYEYEVFLSFRGPDTRESFTDILYQKLTEVGVRTFRDDEDLRLGEEIGPDLLSAINQSKISIPVFSKGYASSKWCLKEAAKIAECMDTRKQKVFPIFYYVDPNEVQHQTGSYAESFSEHVRSEKYDASIIQEWRDALKRIGARKGIHLKSSADCHQGSVLQKVVSKILEKLKKPFLDVTENLVGIEDHMGRVSRLLEFDVNDVRMLGIWGMGGIGKTTVAKFIFNQVANQFEYCSFLGNVRGTSREPNCLESLQTQLASDTLRHKFDKFANCDEGKSVLKNRLRDKKVLVLVDDVDQTEQLDYLVGGVDWFGPGSRIFVTTRQSDVLDKSNVEWIKYEVQQMHQHNAFTLFCKHAFRRDSPPLDFDSLSWDIVEATGGLPLAIQAIGSSLSIRRDKTFWEEAVNSMKTKKDIHDKLKVSYDALSHEQREVFLDIACLFNGADKRILAHMWKARGFSPESVLRDLVLRSLIKIGDDNILWMHDCLIDLGREIVRRESHDKLGAQSRLWYSTDAIKVLEAKMGTEKVIAIHLDCGTESEKCRFSREHFENLSYLQFLDLGKANVSGDLRGCLSMLTWLRWHGRNLLDMPFGLHPKNLIILDLSKSQISSEWKGWSSIKESVNLEVLDLTGCHQLIRTPDFSTFLSMKRLILEDCQGLVEIGPSIGELKSLEFLNLKKCLSLKKLPIEFESLVALTELLLDESHIVELPISSGMKKLRTLSAKSCSSMTDIPHSIGELKSLEELNLSRTGVVRIPESIGSLNNLKAFSIDQCFILELPQSLWKLRKLEIINASGCRNLSTEIPSDLGSLNSLKVLRLDRTSITRIPESITELSRLQTLDLKDCMKLQTLPNLPRSLVNLKVTLTSSGVVPNLPDLVNLKELEILHCGELSQVLMDIEKFSKIEKLTIAQKHFRELE